MLSVCACVCIVVYMCECRYGCISASFYLSVCACVRNICVYMCVCVNVFLIMHVRYDMIYRVLLFSTQFIYMGQIRLLFLALYI